MDQLYFIPVPDGDTRVKKIICNDKENPFNPVEIFDILEFGRLIDANIAKKVSELT